MNIFDFISSYFFFDKIGLFTFLSVILLSYFTVYSLRKNQCITYYPFLAAIWFLTLILEFTCDNLVLNNLFNYINTDIILFYYADIILPISLIVFGKHYFIHTGLKILFLLIVFKWNETRILAQLLIIITDCMFGYVILQFISSIRWKRSKKGLTKE